MLASGQGRWWELRGLYSVLVNSLFSVMWEAESLAESKDAGGVKSLRREKKKRNNNLKEQIQIEPQDCLDLLQCGKIKKKKKRRETPWTEEPDRLQSMESPRVGQDLALEH